MISIFNFLKFQVMRNTGFFKGLYSKEELNSENVKERDNKIIFLQKTIEVVSKCKY